MEITFVESKAFFNWEVIPIEVNDKKIQFLKSSSKKFCLFRQGGRDMFINHKVFCEVFDSNLFFFRCIFELK